MKGSEKQVKYAQDLIKKEIEAMDFFISQLKNEVKANGKDYELMIAEIMKPRVVKIIEDDAQQFGAKKIIDDCKSSAYWQKFIYFHTKNSEIAEKKEDARLKVYTMHQEFKKKESSNEKV